MKHYRINTEPSTYMAARGLKRSSIFIDLEPACYNPMVRDIETGAKYCLCRAEMEVANGSYIDETTGRRVSPS